MKRRRVFTGLAIGCASLPLVILWVFASVIGAWLVFDDVVSIDIAKYNEDLAKISALDPERQSDLALVFLPELDTLPPHERLQYRWKKDVALLSNIYTVYVVVTYNEATYAAQKEELLALELGEQCELGSFEFHVRQESYIPKSIGFLGFSDTQRKVAYLYFFDHELDVFSPSPVEAFIVHYFSYNFS